MTTLSKKLGEMSYDGLLVGTTPAPQVGGAIIRRLGEAATLKRGTILAKSSTNGMLVVLGTEGQDSEQLEPYGILTDDIEVGTTADVTVTIYIAGCFNLAKCIVKEGYTMTEADKDALRKYSIIFKEASAVVQ